MFCYGSLGLFGGGGMTAVYRARAPKSTPDPTVEHEYSSVMVPISGRAADIAKNMQKAIQKSDLNPEEGGAFAGPTGSDGIEHDLHITCRWGLRFQTPSVKFRQALKAFGPIQAELGATSLFHSKEGDVLKVDVKSEDLHRLYKLIGRLVPTHTTFPVYRPHVTLAYLKPGRGKKYVGEDALKGQKLTFNSVIFSGKKGHRETLPLGSASPGPYRVR